MFELNKYQFVFTHFKARGDEFSDIVPERYHTMKLHFTKCNVYEVLNEDGDLSLVSEGLAICSPKDVYVKSSGRRNALTHAVSMFDKKFRTEIWMKYFSTVSKKERTLVHNTLKLAEQL